MSPVIGVILMVAITVILAAVVGAFVLGLGDQLTESPPQIDTDASVNSSYTVGEGGELVRFEKRSGETVNNESIEIVVRNSDGARNATLSPNDWEDTSAGYNASTAGNEDDLIENWRNGDQIVLRLNDAGGPYDGGDEITVQFYHLPTDGIMAEHTIIIPE